MNCSPERGPVRPRLRSGLPSPCPGPYQCEEEDRLGKVGVGLEVPDGLCLPGLFPALHQQLGGTHLLHVPEPPDQDLPEREGRQHLCGGVCAGSDGASGSTQGLAAVLVLSLDTPPF